LETDIDTVKLSRDPVKMALAEINPDQFPPERKAMGVDLIMWDEFGSDMSYKIGGKGRQENTSA